MEPEPDREAERGRVYRRLVLAGLIVSQLVIGAPHPKLVREINLNQSIREPESLLPSSHTTYELVFSPNEKWIAISVGRHKKPGSYGPGENNGVSHLLAVPVGDPGHKIVQIDPGLLIFRGMLRWVPNSDAMAVSAAKGPILYSIPSGEPWTGSEPDGKLSYVEGFIDAEHGLARQARPFSQRSRPVTLDTFELSGQVDGMWTPPGRWAVDDVSPDEHTILMTDWTSDSDPKTFVLDYRTKAIIQKWPEGSPFWKQSFAEAGKSVCSVGSHGRGSEHAQCWDVASGKRIAQFTGFTGGQDAAVSTHGSRVVLTHIRFFKGITEEFDMKSYKNRVVWDFRAGKEVAAWEPLMQVDEQYNKVTEWGPFAISPSGRLLAEGGNGVLRIYSVP